ncbi:MAG: class IV adenylate cyclase [Pirellulales bacterium]
MIYEVENKFAIADPHAQRARFAVVGAKWSAAEVLVDRYFAHPCRDFRQTDEALRIRAVGEEIFVTYKGPKLDKSTKTRRELELPVGHGQPGIDAFHELLESLGFQPVVEVRKHREHAQLAWEGQTVTACWDEVDELGTYVELEIAADEAQLSAAQAAILSCAQALGLGEPIRRSYLGMLLALRAM